MIQDLAFSVFQAAIEDCAKDGSEEFFTEMHSAFFNRIPIGSLKICNSNAMHLGKKFLAAIFSAILHCCCFMIRIWEQEERIIVFSLGLLNFYEIFHLFLNVMG